MKGILFRPEMIRAIIEGKKIQTRRVIKPQPIPFHPKNYPWKTWYDFGSSKPSLRGCLTLEEIPKHARYQVGEVVYIKEAWAVRNDGKQIMTKRVFEGITQALDLREFAKERNMPFPEIKFKSPLFMPESVAELFIKITDIRAERLRLPLSPEELKLEGGEVALSILEKINGLWVFVYSFKKAEK